MKQLLTFVFLLFTTTTLIAQELSKELGSISMLDMNYQSEDEKAEAVKLFDIGKVEIKYNSEGYFYLEYTRSSRIKILKNEGSKWADVKVVLYHSEDSRMKERVKEVTGNVYNIDEGEIVKTEFDKKQVFKEKYNDHLTFYKFTLPKVKVGSVIEYEYKVISPFLSQLPEWAFQDRIPTLYSEYYLTIVPYYDYYFVAQNIRDFSFQESKILPSPVRYYGHEYRLIEHRFVMEDVIAFRDENYITSIEDYLMKANFQLNTYYNPFKSQKSEYVSTWGKLHENLLKDDDFGKYIKKVEKLAQKIYSNQPYLLEGTTVEKVKKIVQYVKQNYIWDNEFGIYAHQSLKSFQETKTGSVGSINLFLIGMLRAGGIQADPLLLSTRHNGKIFSEYPFKHYYNYLIAYLKIDRGQLLLDATTSLLAYNELPVRCLNEKGIILNDDGETWIKIRNHVKSYDKTTLTISFSEDLSTSEVKVKKSLKGMDAYVYKREYQNTEQKLKEYFENKGLENIGRILTAGVNTPTQSYEIKTSAEKPVEQLVDKIILKPFFDFPLAKNPFTEKERNYIIDFIYANSKEYIASILVPEGYTIKEVPENLILENDLITINFFTHQIENELLLKYTYQFKKDKFNPQDYIEIKKTFALLVEKLNVQLVLEPLEN
ncbi:DUF3857 domain-containing protein [Flammeovirga sp. SJP92]|uniref:DUF3857 domain-containing protein n=1 Tax=Flammeovirga sp. SJP92 TaxID=1775430 RepID=UPI0007896DD9|nr:DUF3857 domain-containing protein [Flammeovirga sp. SJP92]KXX70318.1 hypothetical protein AVL50_11980 [Flammeovirga sp. SJP92]